MNFFDTLQIRYEAVLETESNVRFYQNIHKYIDIIMKNDELSSIINKSAEEYRVGHAQIWHPYTKVESEIKERSRQTYKLEMFNLYTADFTSIYVRIYIPIEDYIKSADPDSEQDPLALLMLFGIKSHQVKFWTQNRRSMPPSAAMQSLKMYNKWYTKKERKQYEQDFKNFHVDFLTAAANTSAKNTDILPKSVSEIPLKLDPRTGDFHTSVLEIILTLKKKLFVF